MSTAACNRKLSVSRPMNSNPSERPPHPLNRSITSIGPDAGNADARWRSAICSAARFQARPPRRRLGHNTALGSHRWRNRPNRRIEEGVAASPPVLSTSSSSLFSLRVPWLCLKWQVGLVHKPFSFKMFPNRAGQSVCSSCGHVPRSMPKTVQSPPSTAVRLFFGPRPSLTAFCRTLPYSSRQLRILPQFKN